MNYTELLNLNVYDSADLSDVLYYTNTGFNKLAASLKDLNEQEYFGYGERENIEKWKYPNFSYRTNKYNFRIEGDHNSADLGVFGCSFTYGQGLPTEMLWHTHIAKRLNASCLNFGISGTSVSSISDVFAIVTKHIKLKTCIVLLPSFQRLQIGCYSNHEIKQLAILTCIPGYREMFKNQGFIFDEYQILKYLPEDDLIKNFKNAVNAIDFVSKVRNIKTHITSWNPVTYNILRQIKLSYINLLPEWKAPPDLDITEDRARDDRHPGPIQHKYFAETIYPHLF